VYWKDKESTEGIDMLVIGGLVLLVIAVVIGLVGVLGNAGAAHPLTENFSVLGYHVTGSTGTLFLFGIVVGALALLGLSVLLAGARRTARRGRNARRDLQSSQRENVYLAQDRDRLLEHQRHGDAAASSITNSDGATKTTRRPGSGLLSRFSRVRQTYGQPAR
jgi:hypothetical protein